MPVSTTLRLFKKSEQAYAELIHSPTTGYAVAHNHLGHRGYRFFSDVKSAEKFYARKVSLIVKWILILDAADGNSADGKFASHMLNYMNHHLKPTILDADGRK